MPVDNMNQRDKQKLQMFKREEDFLREKYSSDPARVKEKIMELHRADGFEPERIHFRSFLRKTAVLAVGLAAWYTYLGQPQDVTDIKERYQLPAQIQVIDSSVPYTTDSSGNRVVQTKDIDFSADSIDIATERYHFVKSQEWPFFRAVGKVFSSVTKLYFWDHNMGRGVDADRARALLAMAEDRDELDYVTIRVNCSAPVLDIYRLFNDPKIIGRNPFLARATIGVLDVVKSGIESKLYRGDYYNPFTQTAVVYSNLESIGAHELGHRQDFGRFGTDWIYALSRPFFPVMLYQEWKASQNAKGIMSEADQWQFDRYLMPGFLTYLIASWYITKKALSKIKENHETFMREARQAEEAEARRREGPW